jgi:hypothetical protein
MCQGTSSRRLRGGGLQRSEDALLESLARSLASHEAAADVTYGDTLRIKQVGDGMMVMVMMMVVVVMWVLILGHPSD